MLERKKAAIALMALIVSNFFYVNLVWADPIQFTDQAGRDITLPSVPKRVATIATPAGSMVVTITNDGNSLVGTSPNSHNAIIEGVLDEFYPELSKVSSDIISKQGTPNIEELLNLDPDVVLQWARKTKSIDALEAAGLTVVGMKYQKIDIAKTWLTDIALMMDKKERAEKILKWHQSAYKRITSKTKQVPDANKPKVLYMLAPQRAAGPNSHFQFFMDTAGAKNALSVDAAFVDIDPEMVLEANPDIIWLFGFNAKLTPETIYNNPILSSISAVKNKRVYKVPVGGDRWDPPNQESPLGWEWFTRTVHPDLLDGSIRDSILSAYPMLYGKTPSEAQMAHILREEMNKDGKDYVKIIH